MVDLPPGTHRALLVNGLGLTVDQDTRFSFLVQVLESCIVVSFNASPVCRCIAVLAVC